ncbi:MAG: ATP-dependent DNA helicase [Deltaproteobacteria bacterium]|nr:ATP-dependent DNA helicase [Deltaproteobacteria bacterium]
MPGTDTFGGTLKANDLKTLLGPDGPLATWDGFEDRPQQTQMALEVERAFNEDDLALIEAGTGTGKTLAYLLPALLSDKVTVVSTGLKNLQDQIYQKDINFIKKHYNLDFKVALIKGRDNYVCRRLLRSKVGRANIMFEDENWKYQLAEWVGDTLTGLLEDMPEKLAKKIPADVRLYSTPEGCRKRACYHYRHCFYFRNYAIATNSKIILVNHHIFVKDLIIKGQPGDNTGLLPQWDAVIIDEAHLLEGVATSLMGAHLNISEIQKFLDQIMDLFEKGKLKDDEKAELIIENCLKISDILKQFPPFFDNVIGEEELYAVESYVDQEREEGIKNLLTGIYDAGMELGKILPTPEEEETPETTLPVEEPPDIPDEERLDIFAQKLSYMTTVAKILSDNSDDSYAYQVTVNNEVTFEKSKGKNVRKTDRNITLSALPIEAGILLGKKLKETNQTAVLTSATLSTGGNFNYVKDRLGLDRDTPSMSLSSPFDYDANTRLYVPEHLPAVSLSSEYSKAFLKEAVKVLNLSKGRALILFTSIARLKEVEQQLAPLVPWPILAQFKGTKADLLERFKSNVSSVLLATSSFWQGVDVPGESLSVVIIDRLPFERPTMPLYMARCRKIRRRGLNPFLTYSLPQMTLTLRQGLGRLLRTGTDRGLLAIFDHRVTTTRYGHLIAKSLPPSQLVTKFSEVEEFLANL